MKRVLVLAGLTLLIGCRAEAPKEAANRPANTHRPHRAVVRMTGDPHSYSHPEELRVTHVSLDLTADFARKQLYGTAVLRFNNSLGVRRLVLDTNGLQIHSILLQPGNTPAKFSFGPSDPVLGRALEIAIRPETSAVAIDYASGPGAKALQWLDPAMTAGRKQPFLLSQSEAILARTWVPCQDTPSVRFTYDAKLHVPPGFMALMSADNPQERRSDGVYQFTMPQPIPSYLLAIAVGDIEFRSFDSRSGVYAEPAIVADAAREFDDTPKMMDAASALYGPYRWSRYDLLVLPPSFPYGGMENPRLTFVTPTVLAGDKSLVSLVAHELAHSWSGNLVTNATWSDFWLNEGVTTYIERRISEKLYGREYSEMLWQLGISEMKREMATLPPADQGLYVNLAGRDPDDAPGTVYDKGALFLRLLEETAGRDRFDRFLRTYFDTFAFQPMTTARFIEYLDAALPDVVRKVNVHEWVYGAGLPADAPQPHSEGFAKAEAAADAFARGASAGSLATDGWSSLQWVHFVESLPALTPERMAALDARFHFSDSRNSEVLFSWLQKAIAVRYKAADPAVERFLTSQGRRRFIVPIYEALAKNGGEDLALARRIYASARPAYHPVSQAAVDRALSRK